MCKTTFAPGQLLSSVHMEKSYLGKAGSPVLYTTGNPPLEVAPRQRKAHVNSYRRQTVHRGKVDPGSVSCPGAMSCPGIMCRGPKCQRDRLIFIEHGKRPFSHQATW